MASVGGRGRSRRRGEGGGGSFERNAAHSAGPAVDRHGDGPLRKQASNFGIFSDSLFAVENRRSKPNKASGVPMKRLIDEEFSKDVNARHTSPGVVGRLMGLDSLPSFGAHSQHGYTQSHAHRTSACSSHDRYGFSQDIPHRRSTDEMPEVKDVFEVMEATRIKVHRSPRSRNGNVTSRYGTTENADLDFIRQKFMDAKRLSTNESLQMSEELNETLDALVSNKDLLLEFLQKLEPVVRKDLQDPGSPSSTANCITILIPSRRNQFIDTDNIYSQDEGTEAFFLKQKEVKYSMRKPHAKLSSQSPTEDSGSLRQKLSRSSHQEISDKRVSPTRIVVLKPSLEKAQDIEEAFALTHEIPHSDYRRHKASQDAGIWSPYSEDSMCQAPLSDSETLGHIAKGSREIAREITKQMRAAKGGGSRKQVLKPHTSTFVSDERLQFLSSLTKLKTSEAFHRSSELCDGWASSGFNSSPAHATETSVSKEAKKHLSNRWKMTHQYQHQAPENNGFSVLGDMFALSDQEASKVATRTMSCQQCPKGELHRDRMPGSCSNPLGIISNDGWRDVSTSNLTRSKSLPSSSNHGVQKSSNRKRTGRHNEFSMLKDVLKVGPHDSEYACRSRQRKSLVRGSTFHGDKADLVSPDNEERMMVEREIHVSSEGQTNVITTPDSSEQTLTHTVDPGHELDAMCHLDTSSAVLEQKKEHLSLARLNQQMHQQPPTALDCCLLVPTLDNLVIKDEEIEQHLDDDYSAVCNPPTGSESPAGIDHNQGADNQDPWIPPTGSEYPVSSNNDDQPSPVSVLESSLDAEDVYSGDFEKISADLQGLRMQLRLLKMETTDDAEDNNLFMASDDEIASTSQPLPEMEISHAFRDEEERDFSYVLDMLILLGINAANQDELLDMCYFSECPTDPDLYDILENKYNSLILWPPSERKLLFDLTNAVVADIVTSLVHHGSKGLLQRFSSRWDQEGFVEEVWQRVVQQRQEMECTQEGLSMDLEWLGSDDGMDLGRSEIGRMLYEDLLEETITEFLGITIWSEIGRMLYEDLLEETITEFLGITICLLRVHMKMIKAALYLMVALAVASCALAGRVLDEQPAAPPVEAPLQADPLPTPTDPPADPVVVPTPAAAPAALPLPTNVAGAAGIAPTTDGATAGGAGTAGVVGAAGAGDHPLTFFMHDILGGSQPSARIVTGVVASAAANGQLPFARPNANIFPIQGAVPLPQGAANLINSNNVPYVAGLGSTSGNLVQNNGNKNIPFVNASDLPSGATLQNLLFGTTTVIDDELTEGHELGAAVIGRAQGFYVASSQDGTSKTIVLTAMFEGEGHGDTLSFFGVHRMAAPESHIAITSGTGKYDTAKGFAAIQTLHPGDQHTTDGVETLLQFNIHLA